MLIAYKNECTDPWFNLASEEYLLENSGENDIFMLWRNAPCVVIGKSQNAYSEINFDYIRENGIKVVRRLTGGGAVFHDLGNVNFTFITSENKCGNLDFRRFISPIIDALRSLGINAEISGRNDITVDGKKVSGNAQCVHNGKVLHHGTLLFGADISGLTGALKVNEEKIKSKGIKSVRSRVANLSEYLPQMSVTDFKDYLETHCAGVRPTEFTVVQKEAIQRLSDEKYSSWDWNFGKSWDFSAKRIKYYPYGLIEIGFESKNGIIEDISLRGDFFGVRPVEELEKQLCGAKLDYDNLLLLLQNVDSYIFGALPSDIAGLILGDQ